MLALATTRRFFKIGALRPEEREEEATVAVRARAYTVDVCSVCLLHSPATKNLLVACRLRRRRRRRRRPSVPPLARCPIEREFEMPVS